LQLKTIAANQTKAVCMKHDRRRQSLDRREVSSFMWKLKIHYCPYPSVFASAHKWIYSEQAERSSHTYTLF